MTLEFDPAQSARTKADPKCGLDFVEARQLWLDPDRLEVALPFSAEPRMAVIGRIGSRTWTAIITRRGDAIRINSVRRSHPKEEVLYEHD